MRKIDLIKQQSWNVQGRVMLQLRWGSEDDFNCIAWLRWKHFHLGRRPWVSSIYSNARTAFDTLNLHDSEGEITLNNARAHMLMWAYFPVMREISWVEKCWSPCWLLAFQRLNESSLDELELLREFWVTNLIKEIGSETENSTSWSKMIELLTICSLLHDRYYILWFIPILPNTSHPIFSFPLLPIFAS